MGQIHYINNGQENDTTINYAFFLENSKLMAARNGGKTIKNQKISKNDLDLNYTTILYLLEFMIGNTDWDVDLHKNVKFIDLSWYDKIIRRETKFIAIRDILDARKIELKATERKLHS